MDIRELFSSCRSGDLKKIKYLVEQKEVDLNVRDRWDSTPLYYACLCGHEELADYLLENGARCEAQTFDGERILYGALTNQIRNKLRNYNLRVASRDDYIEFLRKLLDFGDYYDFEFVIQQETIPVHRFILAARSPYFWQAFQGKWSTKKAAHLQNQMVDLTAFKSVIQYLYCGRLTTLLDEVDECKRLAKQCRLPTLSLGLEEARKRATSFAESKPGTRIKVLSLESCELQTELQRDLGQLAKQAIPSVLIGGPIETNRSAHPLGLIDVCFIVDNYKFTCHKAVFAGRSEYFKALFRDHFGETSRTDLNESGDSEDASEVDVVKLRDVTAVVFAQIVHYVYSNNVQVDELSVDIAFDLLNAGELYLMNGLKKFCANYFISTIDSENVIDLIKVSRTYNLPRVEGFCSEFIARHLEEVVESQHFHQLIVDDALEVKGRQETDSISTIDDIRYHIDMIHQDSLEADTKHFLIDQLLEKLNLEA